MSLHHTSAPDIPPPSAAPRQDAQACGLGTQQRWPPVRRKRSLGTFRHFYLPQAPPDWKLRQIAPGTFAWTTPAGRAYSTTPDTHAM
jgi:hypothetical protein